MNTIKLPEHPTSLKLFSYIKKKVDQMKDKPLLGFNEATLPDQEFLINFLFNLDPTHKIFQKSY